MPRKIRPDRSRLDKSTPYDKVKVSAENVEVEAKVAFVLMNQVIILNPEGSR